MVDGNWEVAYFADDEEVALVIVDPHDAARCASRGPATRSPGRWPAATRAPSATSSTRPTSSCRSARSSCSAWSTGAGLRRVANLDLLVLLGFGVSHFFFNRAEIGVSVPLVLPGLALPASARALWIGFRGRGEGLRPVWPAAWLLVAALFLMGFRVGLNIADSGAIDVGYAGVVGADRIAHGEPIYGNFPDDVSQGDTYGPVNYFAYVPFERIWPWSGTWDDLPAAHGAAVLFDLATFALLILLGLRIRPGPAGRRLAAILAFGWAAYPYTAFALRVELQRHPGRGAPRRHPARPRPARSPGARWPPWQPSPSSPRRCWPRCCLTYRAQSRGSPPLFARSPSPARDRRGACSGRRSTPACTRLRPHDRLPGRPRLPVQHLGPGALAGTAAHRASWSRTGALSLLFAFRPRRKSLVQVAALGAALLIGAAAHRCTTGSTSTSSGSTRCC